MARVLQPATQETISQAEQLLEERFGSPAELDTGEHLMGSNRSLVYRFHVLNGPASLPSSLIVKRVNLTEQAAYYPDAPDIPAWTFFNEWASLEFLSQFATKSAFCPQFYVGNREMGMIVMEDLGMGKGLHDFLLGNDPQLAEAALLDFATLRGKMHALTFDKQEEFKWIRERLGPRVLGTGYYAYDWLSSALETITGTFDVAPVQGVEAELATLQATLLHPEPFLAYTQGDSCPDNCLFVNDKLYFIDFEAGKFDFVLKEAVYGRMHFPTCWCVYRLPEDMMLRMEAAYRAELVKGCPAAADDALFYKALVEACAFWLLDIVNMLSLDKTLHTDRVITAASDRQRVLLRFDNFAATAATFGHMEALGATMRSIASKLRESWPEAASLQYYPAFQ